MISRYHKGAPKKHQVGQLNFLAFQVVHKRIEIHQENCAKDRGALVTRPVSLEGDYEKFCQSTSQMRDEGLSPQVTGGFPIHGHCWMVSRYQHGYEQTHVIQAIKQWLVRSYSIPSSWIFLHGSTVLYRSLGRVPIRWLLVVHPNDHDQLTIIQLVAIANQPST